MKKLLFAAIALAAATQAGEVQEVERISKLPRWEGSRVEARLWDQTRVDLLTETHAIEADWPYKWAEAIGQALYYAELTGKKPGIILLVKDFKKESRYVYRCQTVCAKHGIKLWIESVKKPKPKYGTSPISKIVTKSPTTIQDLQRVYDESKGVPE